MRFRNKLHNRGQILVIVALSSTLLIAFAGLAIDSGLTYGVKAKLNAAVDAAALAGARATATGASDASRTSNAVSAAAEFFHLNFPSGYLGATSSGVSTQAVHQADGTWQVTASADATRPTFLMGVLGLQSMSIHAQAQTVRRNVDLMLVLDNSGSLGSPPGTFSQLQASAVNFINNFASGPGGDRIGLVTFASGAVLNIPIDKTATRGFNLTQMTAAINGLKVGGYTTSAEAMQIAQTEIDAIPAALRSSLRVVVFFSDGAPNTVPAVFTRTSGAPVSGDLSSDPSATNGALAATLMYPYNQVNGAVSTYTGISTLPTSGGLYAGAGSIPIPLASYDNIRTLSGNPPANTLCNVNIAARNMLENAGNIIRGEGILVMTLGLGADLTRLEPIYSNNCVAGTAEYGQNILNRLANSASSDTYNPNQPTGYYEYAADQTQLEAAFNAVASEVLRLTQ